MSTALGILGDYEQIEAVTGKLLRHATAASPLADEQTEGELMGQPFAVNTYG